jgi:hypothetical protein
MKKITLVLSFFALLLLVSCGPGRNEAIKYNDHIMDIVNKLTLSHNGFLNQIDGHNVDSLKITHQLFSDASKACLDEIKKEKAFGERTEYRDAAVAYFTALNAIADNEGKQMTEVITKDPSEVTEADISKVSELSTKFDADYEKAFNTIEAAQITFAKEWKFEIKKTKETK